MIVSKFYARKSDSRVCPNLRYRDILTLDTSLAEDASEREKASMSIRHINDQDYLLRERYKDASDFSACLQIIKPLLTSQIDYHRWIFSKVRKAPRCRVLELGCGPGDLWRENAGLIPADWEITLSDFSAGMLKDTEKNLSTVNHRFTFQVIDAQSIPFEAASFDRVIADCMLYHVPDRARAIAEISRVLKPGGYLYAATFSKRIFSELEKLLQACKMTTWLDTIGFASTFCLENGREQLAPHFSRIKPHRLKNTLVVTDVEPLLTLMQSITPREEYDETQFQHLRQLAQQEIARKGAMHFNFDMELFEASGPK